MPRSTADELPDPTIRPAPVGSDEESDLSTRMIAALQDQLAFMQRELERRDAHIARLTELMPASAAPSLPIPMPGRPSERRRAAARDVYRFPAAARIAQSEDRLHLTASFDAGNGGGAMRNPFAGDAASPAGERTNVRPRRSRHRTRRWYRRFYKRLALTLIVALLILGIGAVVVLVLLAKDVSSAEGVSALLSKAF